MKIDREFVYTITLTGREFAVLRTGLDLWLSGLTDSDYPESEAIRQTNRGHGDQVNCPNCGEWKAHRPTCESRRPARCPALFELTAKGGLETVWSQCIHTANHPGIEHKAIKPGGMVRWTARKKR